MTNGTHFILPTDDLKNGLFARHIKEQERDMLTHYRGQNLNMAA
jgi:hypothetical protein